MDQVRVDLITVLISILVKAVIWLGLAAPTTVFNSVQLECGTKIVDAAAFLQNPLMSRQICVLYYLLCSESHCVTGSPRCYSYCVINRGMRCDMNAINDTSDQTCASSQSGKYIRHYMPGQLFGTATNGSNLAMCLLIAAVKLSEANSQIHICIIKI